MEQQNQNKKHNNGNTFWNNPQPVISPLPQAPKKKDIPQQPKSDTSEQSLTGETTHSVPVTEFHPVITSPKTKTVSSKKAGIIIGAIVATVVIVAITGIIISSLTKSGNNSPSRSNADSNNKTIENNKKSINNSESAVVKKDINDIDSDNVSDVYGFNDGYGLFQYTTDDEYHGTNYHYACVDSNGKITFNDANGLSDDDGNTFFIDCRFESEIPYTEYAEYLWDYESSEEYYNYTSELDSPLIFDNGYICCACRDCDADQNGNYYVCIINTKGEVKYKWLIGAYDCEKNMYSEDSSDDSGASVAILNNGNGTYLFCSSEKNEDYVTDDGYMPESYYDADNPETDFYTYYAVSVEKGELKKEEMRKAYNQIYSLGCGYFRCHEEKVSVKTQKFNKYVIDKNGNKLSNDKALKITRFVTESLSETENTSTHEYLDINTNKNVGSFTEAKKLVGKGDNVKEIYEPVDFSYGKGYAGCFIQKGEDYDEDTTISYVKLDENGDYTLLKTFNNTLSWGEEADFQDYDEVGHWDCDYIKYLTKDEDRIVIQENGKYYSFNLKTGETIQLFKEYGKLITELHVCNGIVEADIDGKDRVEYFQIFGMDGKEIVKLTENNTDFYQCFLTKYSGFDYSGGFVTSDGDCIDNSSWDGIEYRNGIISVFNHDGNGTHNYITQKGELLIE